MDMTLVTKSFLELKDLLFKAVIDNDKTYKYAIEKAIRYKLDK